MHRENSDAYHVDEEKIFLGGGSAGGIIAANLCYKDGTGAEPWDKSGIIGHVNLWGVPDPSSMQAEIDRDDPPTIIVHGTEDPLVPFVNSERLVEELLRQEVKHELITIEGAGHAPARHIDDFAVRIARFLNEILSQNAASDD